MQRVDAQATVVGKRRKPAEVGRFARFEVGVVGECIPDFLRLREAEFLGADARNAERFDERGDFAQLAGIVCRDDELVADRPHRPVAFSWAAKISQQPIRARRSRRSKPSSS